MIMLLVTSTIGVDRPPPTPPATPAPPCWAAMQVYGAGTVVLIR